MGNFELRFTAEFPFSFPGGGLIIRFSDPSTSYQADNTCTPVLVNASSTDTSGFFVRRAYRDADGLFPWIQSDTTAIGAFQVVTTDPTPPAPPEEPLPPPSPPDDGAPPPDASDFRLGKVKKNKKKGTAKLTVRNLPGAGQLELAKNKKVKGKKKTADAGKEKLPIKARGKAKKRLNSKGKTKVNAKVTYTSEDGSSSTKRKKIKLVKR